MTTKIISLRLPADLIEQADALASGLHLSRTRLVELLLTQALQANDLWRDSGRLGARADHPFHWKGRKE